MVTARSLFKATPTRAFQYTRFSYASQSILHQLKTAKPTARSEHEEKQPVHWNPESTNFKFREVFSRSTELKEVEDTKFRGKASGHHEEIVAGHRPPGTYQQTPTVNRKDRGNLKGRKIWLKPTASSGVALLPDRVAKPLKLDLPSSPEFWIPGSIGVPGAELVLKDVTPQDATERLSNDILDIERKSYLRGLVDIYGDAKAGQPRHMRSNSTKPNNHRNNGERYNEQQRVHENANSQTKKDHTVIIRQLYCLVKEPKTPWRKLWAKVSELDSPRAAQIPDGLLRNVLRHMALQDPDDPDHKGGDLMNAYFALIDDMARSNIRIWRKDWNTAMHLALKSKTTVAESDLEDAMRTWHLTEKEYKCKANSVTFTILYLAAAKAGRYGVADRLWSEMQSRGLPLDRTARIVEINVSGMRRNREGILNSYVAMIEDGHIIDINVLNSVISAFAQAGEISAAEEVLQRVQAMNTGEAAARASDTWQEQRATNKLLSKAAHLPVLKRQYLQMILHTRMIPTEKSYRPLIDHYAVVAANLDRTKILLNEMAAAKIPISQAIVYLLFKAFAKHGLDGKGVWTPDALRDMWPIYQQMLDDPTQLNDDGKLNLDPRVPVTMVMAFVQMGLIKEAAATMALTIIKWDPPAWAALRITQLLEEDTSKRAAPGDSVNDVALTAERSPFTLLKEREESGAA